MPRWHPARRGRPRTRAEWHLRGTVHTVRRTAGGAVQLVGVDKLGDAVTLSMPAWQGTELARAIEAAAQPEEKP